MAIETLSQLINVEAIASVVVTDIAHDDVRGDYTRDIKFFVDGVAAEVLTIRIRAIDRTKLMIGAPPFAF